MVKSSAFLLIASIFFLTLSCRSVTSDPVATSATHSKSGKELMDGLATFFEYFKDFSKSSNVVVVILRDMAESVIEHYEKGKKQLQDAVTKGTEMEKKIRTVSESFKNSTIPFTAELRSELDAIVQHTAAALKKLKEIGSGKDIDNIKEEVKGKKAIIEGNIQDIFKVFLDFGKKVNEGTETRKLSEIFVELKPKLFSVFQTMIPSTLSAMKNEDAISKNVKTTFNALSEIRNGFDRVEEIQYNLLRSCKTNAGTGAASLTCSLLAMFFFAILLDMLI